MDGDNAEHRPGERGEASHSNRYTPHQRLDTCSCVPVTVVSELYPLPRKPATSVPASSTNAPPPRQCTHKSCHSHLLPVGSRQAGRDKVFYLVAGVRKGSSHPRTERNDRRGKGYEFWAVMGLHNGKIRLSPRARKVSTRHPARSYCREFCGVSIRQQ